MQGLGNIPLLKQSTVIYKTFLSVKYYGVEKSNHWSKTKPGMKRGTLAKIHQILGSLQCPYL